MVNKNLDRLSYGITILVFGILFLFQKTGILSKLPYGDKAISVGSFFLIAAVAFLATQPKKTLSWVFLGIAILLNADFFFGWISGYSYLIMPAGLIIAGGAMIFSARK